MLRSAPGQDARIPERNLTGEEARQVAEQLADIFITDSPSLASKFVLAAFQFPHLSDEISRMLGYKRTANWLKTKEADNFRVAVEKKDRSALVATIETDLQKDRMTPMQAESLLSFVDVFPSTVRSGLPEMVKKVFPIKLGRKSKAKLRDNPEIAKFGDRLAPVCEFVVTELQKKTKNTVRRLLEFQEADHPEEVAFLQGHFDRFESVLKDKYLAKRATGLKPRARVVADAMAGADFGLEPTTSLERARTGRRILNKNRS